MAICAYDFLHEDCAAFIIKYCWSVSYQPLIFIIDMLFMVWSFFLLNALIRVGSLACYSAGVYFVTRLNNFVLAQGLKEVWMGDELNESRVLLYSTF